MHPPTLRNVRLSTPDDAYLIVRAVIAGHLPEYPHRLCRDDAASLRVGDIFVYKEGGKAGITRWTDYIRGATPSRNIRGFLCYILPATSSQRPWCKKTTKLVNKYDPHDAWHLVAYDLEDEDNDDSLHLVEEVAELSAVFAAAKHPAGDADYVPAAASSASTEPASTQAGSPFSDGRPEASRSSTAAQGTAARFPRRSIRCQTAMRPSASFPDSVLVSPDTPIPTIAECALFAKNAAPTSCGPRTSTSPSSARPRGHVHSPALTTPPVLRTRYAVDEEMLSRFSGSP